MNKQMGGCYKPSECLHMQNSFNTYSVNIKHLTCARLYAKHTSVSSSLKWVKKTLNCFTRPLWESNKNCGIKKEKKRKKNLGKCYSTLGRQYVIKLGSALKHFVVKLTEWETQEVDESLLQFSSVTSCATLCHPMDCMQHTRPPCPSLTLRVYSNSCPFSHWCHPAISSSVIHFSSCLQYFPASGSKIRGSSYNSREMLKPWIKSLSVVDSLCDVPQWFLSPGN